MKSLSAAIVILASVLLLLGGSYHHHDDSGLFLQFVACIVGLVGLGGWLVSLRENTDANERP